MYFYMVLSDGTTYLSLAGSKIVAVSQEFDNTDDNLDSVISDVCRDGEHHPEVIVVTTFGESVA